MKAMKYVSRRANMPQKQEEDSPVKAEDYDSSSSGSDDEQEEEPTPPPSPPKKKQKKQKKDKEKKSPKTPKTAKTPKTPKAPKAPKKKKKKEDEEEDIVEPMSEDEPQPPVPQPEKPKKKRKQRETVLVPTSDPNIVVEMKKRKSGNGVKNVVIYEEDIPQPKIKLIKRTHTKGRPRTKQEVVFETDEGVDIQQDKVVIDRPAEHKKPLSAKALKRMELDQKFVEMEAIAGRKLRQTKNGQIDKRSIKERTPAQIAAAKRLAEYNKELRKQKAAEKNKTAVKDVITELAVAKEMRDKHTKKQEQQQQQQQPEQDLMYHSQGMPLFAN